MMRLFRVMINSFVFILLVVVAYVMWRSNPLLSVVLLLAAVDQFEDVYTYVYGRRLFPPWFMPFDFVFEMVVLGLGILLFVFSLIYYSYFETWFFRSLLILSIPIMYSAVEDIVLWYNPTQPLLDRPKLVTGYVCQKEVVREEKKFVRRK